jgi:hypothetical protein
VVQPDGGRKNAAELSELLRWGATLSVDGTVFGLVRDAEQSYSLLDLQGCWDSASTVSEAAARGQQVPASGCPSDSEAPAAGLLNVVATGLARRPRFDSKKLFKQTGKPKNEVGGFFRYKLPAGTDLGALGLALVFDDAPSGHMTIVHWSRVAVRGGSWALDLEVYHWQQPPTPGAVGTQPSATALAGRSMVRVPSLPLPAPRNPGEIDCIPERGGWAQPWLAREFSLHDFVLRGQGPPDVLDWSGLQPDEQAVLAAVQAAFGYADDEGYEYEVNGTLERYQAAGCRFGRLEPADVDQLLEMIETALEGREGSDAFEVLSQAAAVVQAAPQRLMLYAVGDSSAPAARTAAAASKSSAHKLLNAKALMSALLGKAARFPALGAVNVLSVSVAHTASVVVVVEVERAGVASALGELQKSAEVRQLFLDAVNAQLSREERATTPVMVEPLPALLPLPVVPPQPVAAFRTRLALFASRLRLDSGRELSLPELGQLTQSARLLLEHVDTLAWSGGNGAGSQRLYLLNTALRELQVDLSRPALMPFGEPGAGWERARHIVTVASRDTDRLYLSPVHEVAFALFVYAESSLPAVAFLRKYLVARGLRVLGSAVLTAPW